MGKREAARLVDDFSNVCHNYAKMPMLMRFLDRGGAVWNTLLLLFFSYVSVNIMSFIYRMSL